MSTEKTNKTILADKKKNRVAMTAHTYYNPRTAVTKAGKSLIQGHS